jgi:hypothetical protein
MKDLRKRKSELGYTTTTFIEECEKNGYEVTVLKSTIPKTTMNIKIDDDLTLEKFVYENAIVRPKLYCNGLFQDHINFMRKYGGKL